MLRRVKRWSLAIFHLLQVTFAKMAYFEYLGAEYTAFAPEFVYAEAKAKYV